jgi:hypothetical protein
MYGVMDVTCIGAGGVTNLTVEQMMLLNNQGGGDPATVQQMLATQMQAANPQLTRQARRYIIYTILSSSTVLI